MHREALRLTPGPHFEQSQSLHHLANILAIQVEQTGWIGNVDEAIVLLKETIKLRPAPHPE